MYLKRIELQGFKSFADKTIIDVHDGITAIVGPNGSGKSNIADAVRWVMGEQSAKALRGGKMEDVIFNGTQKRKALGYAEVSMVFDNTSRLLPCEYTEVEITRRVFRSGESEYMINRNPCRLRDIHELFMDTGMGRDGYSIVGQGKIAEILSQKAEDRRGVFEEAAGISKYRCRKQEAERKLERTEENLTRVKDILSELEGRIEPLAKQSEKAVKYLNFREELKGIEVSALLGIIDARKAQLAETAENYSVAQEQFNSAKKSHDDASCESERLFEKIKEADGEIEELRSGLSAAETKSAQIKSETALTESAIKNTRDNVIRTETELKDWERRGETLRESLSAAENDISAATERLKLLNTELGALEVKMREAVRETAVRGAALDEAKNRVTELGREKAETGTKIEGLEALEHSYEDRRRTLEDDMAAAEQSIADCKAELAEIEESRTATERQKEIILSAANEKSVKFAELSKLVQDKKDECNRLVSLSGEKSARLDMLKEMERGLEGYARSVRDIINDHSRGKYRGNLIGVLSKLIKTDKKYITAIETALGGAMQNIVVNNEAEAKEAIEYLKRNRMGRVTFLPITAQSARRLDGEAKILSSNGALAVAADVVKRDSLLDGVVEGLLGRTLIVDNMDNAVKIAKENRYRFKIVTLEGELLLPGGSITGGSINKSQALLQRSEEISALEKECAKLEKRSEAVEEEIDALSEEYDKVSEEAENERLLLADAEGKLTRLNAEAEMKRSLLEINTKRSARLADEKAALEKIRAEADENKTGLKSALRGSDELIASAESTVLSMAETLKAADEKREAAAQLVTDKRMEIAAAEKDIEIFRQREAELKEQLDNSSADCERRQRLRDEQNKKVKELSEALEKSRAKAEESDAQVRELREKINKRLADKGGTNKRLEEIQSEIKSLSDAVFVAQEEVVRLETRKTRLEGDCESASNRLWDDYELTYNAALPLRKNISSMTSAQKKISELKNKIKALGNINIDAIDEYKEVKQRYEFMLSQVSDLEAAEKNLKKLIAEMLTVMREQFTEKFKIINENFSEIFAELFGGGHGEVRLADPADVLESGIEIEVQPPGKKLQNISLFSGGEHAMTAIALLFALLKVSPSPFIVLDEIEAALDDENVYRFADYIRNYGSNTQFIVITHRRGTMEASDILYGVTMQEKGVSKLLSMKLDDIAAEDI